MKEPISLSFDEWAAVKLLADARMKAANGHAYIHMLTTRCQHCGRSPRDARKCGGWLQTLFGHIDTILLNLDRERENGFLFPSVTREGR